MGEGTGRFVARYPVAIIVASCALTALCGLGMLHLRVETKPEKLWVSPDSRAAKDKAFFDLHYGALSF